MPTVRRYCSTGEHDINYSRQYLGFREATEPGSSVVLIACDDSGKALGGTTAYVTTKETPFFNHPVRLLTSSQVLREGDPGPSTAPSIPMETLHAFEGYGPTLVVSNLGDSRILTHPELGPEDRARVSRSLIEAVNEEARRRACGSTAFLYVQGSDSDLIAALREKNFRIAMCSSRADIDLSEAESLAEYMAALPRSKRRAMEREMRLFAENPLAIRQLDPPERYVDQAAALELQTYARHGIALSAEDVRARLLLQLECTGDTTRLMGCFDGSRLIATAVDLIGRDQYFCTTYGQDHKAADRKYTYQMMSFYDPIEYACRSGLEAVYLGIEALQAKLRRGAIATPLYVALWTAEEDAGIDSWLDHVDERNRQYLLETVERFGGPEAIRSESLLPSPEALG
jgi:predicted N-acyltransferase